MKTDRVAKVIGLLLFPLTALALAAEPAQEPTLKEIMQGLRDDVFVIADGMFADDMDRIAQGAAGIAHHAPIPKQQIQRIVAELGAEMPAFKQFDENVHELSVSIISAAESNDSQRIITDFQQLINGCLACHSSYKQRVTDALK
jgi:hypothetical protein